MLLDVSSEQAPVQPFLEILRSETPVKEEEVFPGLTQPMQQQSASAQHKQVSKTGRGPVVKALLTDTKGTKEQVQGAR